MNKGVFFACFAVENEYCTIMCITCTAVHMPHVINNSHISTCDHSSFVYHLCRYIGYFKKTNSISFNYLPRPSNWQSMRKPIFLQWPHFWNFLKCHWCFTPKVQFFFRAVVSNKYRQIKILMANYCLASKPFPNCNRERFLSNKRFLGKMSP